MDILDYNRHSSATRDEHLLVVNGNQSALPSLHHPMIVYCYYPAMSLQLGNILPPENLELSDHNPMPITQSTRGTEEHVRTTQEFSDMRYVPNWGAYLVIVTVYPGVCAYLVQFIPMKFEKETESPFKTHLGFIAISITSLFMMLITFGIAVYTNGNSKGSVFEVILETLFWCSFVNTPLSLILLLFVPAIYNWTGYVLVFALFVFILAFNFKSLKMSLAVTPEYNMGEIEMKKTQLFLIKPDKSRESIEEPDSPKPFSISRIFGFCSAGSGFHPFLIPALELFFSPVSPASENPTATMTCLKIELLTHHRSFPSTVDNSKRRATGGTLRPSNTSPSFLGILFRLLISFPLSSSATVLFIFLVDCHMYDFFSLPSSFLSKKWTEIYYGIRLDVAKEYNGLIGSGHETSDSSRHTLIPTKELVRSVIVEIRVGDKFGAVPDWTSEAVSKTSNGERKEEEEEEAHGGGGEDEEGEMIYDQTQNEVFLKNSTKVQKCNPNQKNKRWDARVCSLNVWGEFTRALELALHGPQTLRQSITPSTSPNEPAITTHPYTTFPNTSNQAVKPPPRCKNDKLKIERSTPVTLTNWHRPLMKALRPLNISSPQRMDILDYNQHSSARRDEHLLVVNGNQSAIPFVHHARILEYYATMLQLHFRNIPPPPNMKFSDYNPILTTLYTRGRQHVRTPPEITLQNNRSKKREEYTLISIILDDTSVFRYEVKWGGWFAFVSSYLGTCALLVTFIQLKFEKETHTPFTTHTGFIIISIASIFMTLISSGIVVYTNHKLQSLMKEHFSPVFEVILKTLLWFSFINTPLSLMLLLFLPHIYNWTGYVMVCALFLAVIGVKFKSFKRLLAAQRVNNLGAFEMA
ncbi:hypothetical protein LXL04_018695 [Taraxacum kok-saghyz]